MFDTQYDKRFMFSYKQDGKSVTFCDTYHDATPWDAILEDFVNFLESTGYVGVRNRISVAYSSFSDGRWSGAVHEEEEDKS